MKLPVIGCVSFIIFIVSFEVEVSEDEAHQQECFYEILKKNDRLDLSFQVAEGGHLDIDFWISSPDNKVLYSVYKESTNTFGFNADQVGKYEYCFSNKMSTFAHKTISFTVMGPDERIRFEEKQKNSDPNHEPLQREIFALGDGLRSIKDEQSYMVIREDPQLVQQNPGYFIGHFLKR
ncbi:p24 complex component [Lobulomyces angularis]|nr:p24 complex component [Lobulomyces angularis]